MSFVERVALYCLIVLSLSVSGGILYTALADASDFSVEEILVREMPPLNVRDTESHMEQVPVDTSSLLAVYEPRPATVNSISRAIEDIFSYISPSNSVSELVVIPHTIRTGRVADESVVLLGQSVTSFKGSSKDRIHNITLAAKSMNGTIVPPGEKFSFLKELGGVSYERGYRDEYVIAGGESMKAPGGGVCQVSTTVFRAILDSGFPVLERHAHSYVVSYYGAGLDATIYYPNKDLIFLNDSSYPIEIRASVSGTSLTISFYGVHDGRKGEVGIVSVYGRTKPLPTRYEYSAVLPKGTTKCREIPRYGMSASVLTSIEYPGESTEQKQYKSTYAPWGTVCTIGTKK